MGCVARIWALIRDSISLDLFSPALIEAVPMGMIPFFSPLLGPQILSYVSC